jgi:hypothetical protein
VRIDGDHLPEGARGVILFEDQEDDGSTTMVEMVLSDNPGDHKAYIRVFETKGNGDQGYMVQHLWDPSQESDYFTRRDEIPMPGGIEVGQTDITLPDGRKITYNG